MVGFVLEEPFNKVLLSEASPAKATVRDPSKLFHPPADVVLVERQMAAGSQ
jgi:hypothetical protein